MNDNSPNSRWLKTPAWLAAQLGKPNVVAVDGSFYLPAQKRDPGAEYLAGHIPGAVFFDIDAVCDHSSDLPHMLAGPTEFAKAAGKLGISDTDTIVVYDGMGLFSSPRVWWNFRIMGAKNVFMLDGGLPAWTAEGHPTEAGEVKREPRTFNAEMDTRAVALHDDIQMAINDGSVQIVDARPAGRFAGRDPEPRPGLRGGHMPGAFNVPASSHGRGRQAGRSGAHQGGVRKGRRRSRQADHHESAAPAFPPCCSASAWTPSASPWAASTTARGPNGAAGRTPTW